MANKPSEKWRIGLYVDQNLFRNRENGISAGDRASWRVRLSPVVIGSHPEHYDSEIDPDRVRNTSDRTDYHGLFLNNFRIEAWAKETESGDREVWFWEMQFDPHVVTIANAGKMAKTFATLAKRIDMLTTEYGTPRTWIDYVRLVCIAAKIQTIVVDQGSNGTGAWGYLGQTHAFYNLGEGLDHIHYKLATWQREGAQK